MKLNFHWRMRTLNLYRRMKLAMRHESLTPLQAQTSS